MKKLSLMLFLPLVLLPDALAVSAHRGWRTVTQSDGSVLELMLVGDESFHCFVTRDSVIVVEDGEKGYCYANVAGAGLLSTGVTAHEADARSQDETGYVSGISAMRQAYALHRTVKKSAYAAMAKKAVPVSGRSFTGSKKGIIILAEFSDCSFSMSSPDGYYDSMANEVGYSGDGTNVAPGSIHDYFYDMSRGVFDLTFDVFGPVRLNGKANSYGGSDGCGYAGKFIEEAVECADAEYDIDWSGYDWYSDGYVDQVFVLYAGYGQATGGGTGTIWPHMYTLDSAYEDGLGGSGKILKDGVYIDTYACSNELYGYSGSVMMGHGTFCHEFSHCMGLPDMYDTAGSNYGMDSWDLLDYGNYNGPNGRGWCPAAWTSYERAFAGWLDIAELQPGTVIDGMKELTDVDGEAYVIYNDGNSNEYYLLENRRQTSWDEYVPDEGLLIIHVDYDEDIWSYNIVNTTGYDSYSGIDNTHQRMTPVCKIYGRKHLDTYPISYGGTVIDSLTDESSPAADLYNPNTDNTLKMHKPVYDIRKDGNGYISFVYMPSGVSAGMHAVGAERKKSGKMTVYDMNGVPVAETSDINRADLPAGVYILCREGGGTEKVVVK